MKAEKLPLDDWTRADDGRLDVTVDDKHYLCDMSGKGACVAKPKPEEPAVLSPDKTREAFIRDWNLWGSDTATGKETQLIPSSEERRVGKECVSTGSTRGSRSQ